MWFESKKRMNAAAHALNGNTPKGVPANQRQQGVAAEAAPKAARGGRGKRTILAEVCDMFKRGITEDLVRADLRARKYTWRRIWERVKDARRETAAGPANLEACFENVSAQRMSVVAHVCNNGAGTYQTRMRLRVSMLWTATVRGVRC